MDFKRLVELGVPLEGKIALAKYGGPFRGLKVKNAQEYGMIGCVIFTDPGDDGNVTEAKGVAAYPGMPTAVSSAVISQPVTDRTDYRRTGTKSNCDPAGLRPFPLNIPWRSHHTWLSFKGRCPTSGQSTSVARDSIIAHLLD